MITHEPITKACYDVFIGTDERDWNRVEGAFAAQVWLDYSSMSGQPAATLTPGEITSAWKGLLPGFDHTHHQLGNVIVTERGPEAEVFCYGTATHYLANVSGGLVWTVVGTYQFHVVSSAGVWHVDRLTFHFKYQDGNLELPKLAAERAKVRA